MLVDARSLPGDASLETDVCVIGAGAAGITLARALSGRPFRVALLESGGFEDDAATQELYAGRVYGRNYFSLDECRTRRFGGSTHCWQGLCRPLDPIDFEARSWVPHSGWPFGADTLRPYYEQAQGVLGLPAFDYAGASWASPGLAPLPFEGEALETRVFQASAARFGTLYRDEVTQAPNVTTYLFANVVGIDAEPEAGRVSQLRVATLEGGAFRVRARRYVLATGGIENARLLLASGFDRRNDRVGRFFMEHPHVVGGALLASAAEPSPGFYRLHPSRGADVAGYVTASEALAREQELLAFASFLHHQAELPELEQSLARGLHEMDQREGEPASHAYFVMSELEQAPNPASRVRLTQQKDALGMPRPQLDWRLSAVDKRSARRAHEILARELGRAGLGRLQILLSPDAHGWPPELGGGRHHMGTTRMHDDPKQGVVDANGRFHGVENLYVAGSSVFPTVGAANPTLTLVALALRLADHLVEQMR